MSEVNTSVAVKVKCARTGLPVAVANTTVVAGVTVGNGSKVIAEAVHAETGLSGEELAAELRKRYKASQLIATTNGMVKLGMLPAGYVVRKGIKRHILEQQEAANQA